MEYSSGIIFYKKNYKGETLFFVCTPDGPFWKNRELWSFPKGHIENGETSFDAAIREFKEETSLEIPIDKELYKFKGIVLQNSHKKVFVYSSPYDIGDTSKCYSNMTNSKYKGKIVEHREIKSYDWMTCEELEKKGIKKYIPIYKEISLND